MATQFPAVSFARRDRFVESVCHLKFRSCLFDDFSVGFLCVSSLKIAYLHIYMLRRLILSNFAVGIVFRKYLWDFCGCVCVNLDSEFDWEIFRALC